MGRELHITDCSSLIDLMENYLQRWKKKTLSFVGKLQLVNWVLLRRLLYWFLAVQLPKRILKKARSIIYIFVWGNKKGVSWRHMSLCKEEGGLGLRDLFKEATACRIKHMWKL